MNHTQNSCSVPRVNILHWIIHASPSRRRGHSCALLERAYRRVYVCVYVCVCMCVCVTFYSTKRIKLFTILPRIRKLPRRILKHTHIPTFTQKQHKQTYSHAQTIERNTVTYISWQHSLVHCKRLACKTRFPQGVFVIRRATIQRTSEHGLNKQDYVFGWWEYHPNRTSNVRNMFFVRPISAYSVLSNN